MKDFTGYEIAYDEENDELSFAILVRMPRKLTADDKFYEVGADIRRQLERVTAQLDPEGPALRAKYRAQIEEIYKAAGVNSIYMEALPNGYCSASCCLNRPWFRVTSKIGHVVIGWRKRVMSIDWKASVVKATAFDLFPEDNVTRFDYGIHAWGLEKATEYIRKLHAVTAEP